MTLMIIASFLILLSAVLITGALASRESKAQRAIGEAVLQREKDWLAEAAEIDPVVAEVMVATERAEMERLAEAQRHEEREILVKQALEHPERYAQRVALHDGRKHYLHRRSDTLRRAYITAETISNMSMDDYKRYRTQLLYPNRSERWHTQPHD